MYLNRHTPGPGVEKLNQIWQEPMSNRSTTNLWKVIAALYEISMMNWLLFVILKWIMCNYYCYQFVMYDTNSRHLATQYQTHWKLKLWTMLAIKWKLFIRFLSRVHTERNRENSTSKNHAERQRHFLKCLNACASCFEFCLLRHRFTP